MKIKKKILVPIIIATLLVTSIYLLFSKSKVFRKSYQLGNYTLSFPINYIYHVQNYDSTKEVEVTESKISNEHCEIEVGKVRHFVTERVYDDIKQGLSPLFAATNWNEDELEYANEKTKKIVEGRLKDLKNLGKYEDKDKLHNLVFSNNYKPGTPILGQLNLQPWRWLTSCGGSFSYPVYIQELDNTNYDQAFYAEAIEGQDWNIPNRILIVRKGKDWLIIREINSISVEKKYPLVNILDCIEKGQSSEIQGMKCIENNWDKHYRTNEKSEKWIKTTLSLINYSGK